MYRPAGIYLINLFPLGNWANTVYFMLKTSISRNEIYMYIYIYTPQSGDSGSGDGGAKEKGRSTTLPIQLKWNSRWKFTCRTGLPSGTKLPNLDMKEVRSREQGPVGYRTATNNAQSLGSGDIDLQRQIRAEPQTGSKSALQSKRAVPPQPHQMTRDCVPSRWCYRSPH